MDFHLGSTWSVTQRGIRDNTIYDQGATISTINPLQAIRQIISGTGGSPLSAASDSARRGARQDHLVQGGRSPPSGTLDALPLLGLWRRRNGRQTAEEQQRSDCGKTPEAALELGQPLPAQRLWDCGRAEKHRGNRGETTAILGWKRWSLGRGAATIPPAVSRGFLGANRTRAYRLGEGKQFSAEVFF